MNAAMLMLPAKARPRRQFQPSDFYEFASDADVQRPPAQAGAAMLELIRRGMFPSFALFVHGDLKAAGKGESPPPRLAWLSDDAILLAPYPLEEGGWGGFLIAQAEAAGRVIEFRSERGERVMLRVPEHVAERGAEMAEDQAILSPP